MLGQLRVSAAAVVVGERGPGAVPPVNEATFTPPLSLSVNQELGGL